MQQTFQTSQIFKWVIPGWIFIGLLLLLIKIDSLKTENNLLEFLKIVEYYDPISTGFFLLLSTAGLPIGYLIYQIYYYLYWGVVYYIEDRMPLVKALFLYWQPNFIMKDEEIENYMQEYELNDLMNKEVNNSFFLNWFKKDQKKDQKENQKKRWFAIFSFIKCPWLQDMIKDTIKNHYHWVLIKRRWSEKVRVEKQNEFIINRMTFLNDIYDSLGATFVAIFLASLTFSLIILCIPKASLCTVWISLLLSIFSFFLFRSNRLHTKRNIFALYKYMLKANNNTNK